MKDSERDWPSGNPRLAYDCGLALTSCEVVARDTAIEALALDPVEGSTETAEQEQAAEVGAKVLRAVIAQLGRDQALGARGGWPAVTVHELSQAAHHVAGPLLKEEH